MEQKEIIHPFDKAVFMSNFEGMEEIIPSTVESFLSALPGLVAKIETAISATHPNDLHIAAHTIKGVVSNFYAEPARLLAFQLEQMGKTQTLTEAEPVFRELVSELDTLSSALKELANEQQAL